MELVADRRAFAAEAIPLQIAAHMRTQTVQIAMEPETVETWQRGDTLVFHGVSEERSYRAIEGRLVATHDIAAVFRSATPSGDGQYDVEVIVGLTGAIEILKADAKSALQVKHDGAPQASTKRDPEASLIRHRRGDAITSIQIPCVDY